MKGKGQLMTYYLQGKVPKNASPILPVTTMETVQEVDEPKESPPALPIGSPAHQITSVSSSTTSPNSVRLNQEYVEMKVSSTSNAVTSNEHHQQQHQQLQQTSEQKHQQATSTTVVSSSESKSDGGTKPLFNGETEEADVKTPLLDDKNSTNANHFSESEKDALIENSN